MGKMWVRQTFWDEKWEVLGSVSTVRSEWT